MLQMRYKWGTRSRKTLRRRP